MKHISRLALSLILILSISLTTFLPVCEAAYVNGGQTKYMYNGVIISSFTYNCTSTSEGSKKITWTILDKSKDNVRAWPETITVKGNMVMDAPSGGSNLCKLKVGNSYDIRVVFVHSASKTPYYYLMIEGAGVTTVNLNGTYTDGVWISDTRNSMSGKIAKGDGIDEVKGSTDFTLDHVTVTDNAAVPDKYYNNHADFRNVVYSDGALHAELLWTPDPQSATAENISILNGGSQITIDKFVCNGNTISMYSKELLRGETYTLSIHDTMKTSLGNVIRVPLKTQYTVPYNDADILSAVFSDGSLELTAQNMTDETFKFTVLIALKSDGGTVEEVIVTDSYTVAPNTPSKPIVIEDLDFKALIPEAYIVKSALLPVPVSDRIYKKDF